MVIFSKELESYTLEFHIKCYALLKSNTQFSTPKSNLKDLICYK